MSDWKVGDELAFGSGYNGYTIRVIDRILPSGRLVCGQYTLNPDLKIRGAGKWGPRRAVPVTDEIRRFIARRDNVSFIRSVRLDTLSSESLAAIVEIIKNDPKQETDE